MRIPQHTLTRVLTRKRIALQRRIRKPFARRRALKTALKIQRDLRARIAERENQ